MAWPRREPEPEPAIPDPAPEDWVDSLLPVDLDWRTAVRRHPWLTLSAVAGVGFVLGNRRGTRLLEDLAELASAGVTAGVAAWLGSDLTND